MPPGLSRWSRRRSDTGEGAATSKCVCNTLTRRSRADLSRARATVVTQVWNDLLCDINGLVGTWRNPERKHTRLLNRPRNIPAAFPGPARDSRVLNERHSFHGCTTPVAHAGEVSLSGRHRLNCRRG